VLALVLLSPLAMFPILVALARLEQQLPPEPASRRSGSRVRCP